MRIIIVGAGPVGLMLGLLMGLDHRVKILEKRRESGRDHGLNIDSKAIEAIIGYLQARTHPLIPEIIDTLRRWTGQHLRTTEIEHQLEDYALRLGIIIERGVSITSLAQFRGALRARSFESGSSQPQMNNCHVGAIIIGADGSRSIIRSLMSGNELVEVETVHHMAQLKFSTPGSTKPRSPFGTGLHSLINGITGPEIVVDFESMSRIKDAGRKTASLHIPIPKSVYEILSAGGRGRYETPWSLVELKYAASTSTEEGRYQVAKLLRVIRRYEISLQWRGGWFENPRVTVLPLTMYRSRHVFTITPTNRLIMLCGDSSSGLIFEQGLGKGWLEAVQCAHTLADPRPEIIASRLTEYTEYCRQLFEQKRLQIKSKYQKLITTNVSTSAVASVMGLKLLHSLGTSVGS